MINLVGAFEFFCFKILTFGACFEYFRSNLSTVLLKVEFGMRFSYSAVERVFERARLRPLTLMSPFDAYVSSSASFS